MNHICGKSGISRKNGKIEHNAKKKMNSNLATPFRFFLYPESFMFIFHKTKVRGRMCRKVKI